MVQGPRGVVVGAAAAAVVATLLAPLGPVLAPWALLRPRRLAGLVRTARYVVVSMIGANNSLSRRIWSRSRPLIPGMVIVPTEMKTEGELTTVGVLTSLIVDNQIIDSIGSGTICSTTVCGSKQVTPLSTGAGSTAPSKTCSDT